MSSSSMSNAINVTCQVVALKVMIQTFSSPLISTLM